MAVRLLSDFTRMYPEQKLLPKAVRSPRLFFRLLGGLVLFGASWVDATVQAQQPAAVLPEKHQTLLKEHCLSCHDAEKQKGKFRIDNLAFSITDNLSAERWQKVLNALNSGEMPPDDQKSPPCADSTNGSTVTRFAICLA